MPVKCVEVSLMDATITGCKWARFSLADIWWLSKACLMLSENWIRQFNTIHAKSKNRDFFIKEEFLSKIEKFQQRKQKILQQFSIIIDLICTLNHGKKMPFTALTIQSAVSCIFWDVICAFSWLHMHARIHTELISVPLSQAAPLPNQEKQRACTVNFSICTHACVTNAAASGKQRMLSLCPFYC